MYLPHILFLFSNFLLDHLSRRFKVIYSHRSPSVCRPSLILFSFKHPFLLNKRNNFNQTSQECSVGGPLSRLFKYLNSIKNSSCCCSRNGAKFPNFKILLLCICLSDSNIIWLKYSLGYPLQNSLKPY